MHMKNINNFIQENQDMIVKATDEVEINQREEINEAYRVMNSQFVNKKDDNGFVYLFYAIIWIVWRTIIMASDLDTKDTNMRSLNKKGYLFVPLLKMAVKGHLMKTGFGEYIDKVLREFVWLGTSITKRVDGRVETVDLRNYTTQGNIKDPQKRSHVEYIEASYEDMLSYKENISDENWKEVEELWVLMQKQNINMFIIEEFWTWDVDEEKFKDDKVHKCCIKYLDKTIVKYSKKHPAEWEPRLEIDKFKTPLTKPRTSKRMIKKLGPEEEMFPYEQIDFFDRPGCVISFGCYSLLKGVQEHYNEKWNLYRKKDILDLRGIFAHKRDSETSNTLLQEFLENLETGDVLQMELNESLERLIIDTKTGEFIASIDKLYELARLIMGVTAQGTGEELPSGTTATVAIANKQTQQTTYDYVRERMNLFLVRLFNNGYFKDILEEIDEEEINAIIGDPAELRKLDEFYITNQVNYDAKKFREENGISPTQEELDAEKERLMKEHEQMGDMRWPDIKKEMVEGINLWFEFYVTNESFDKNVKLQNLQEMINDPNSTLSKNALENAKLELMDENPNQYQKTDEEKLQELEAIRQNLISKLPAGQGSGGGMMQEAGNFAQSNQIA